MSHYFFQCIAVLTDLALSRLSMLVNDSQLNALVLRNLGLNIFDTVLNTQCS